MQEPENKKYLEVFKKVGFLPMFENYEKMKQKTVEMDKKFKNCFEFKTYENKKHRKLWKKYYGKLRIVKLYEHDLEIHASCLKRWGNETKVYYNHIEVYIKFFKDIFFPYAEIFKDVEEFLNKQLKINKTSKKQTIFDYIKNVFTIDRKQK